jgi:lysophospholipase L1-like esterase
MSAPVRTRHRLLTTLAAAAVGVLAACAPAGSAARAATGTTVAGPANTTESTAAAGSHTPLSMVVIGDSIAFNSPQDCPGCTGFVDRYAGYVEQKTGRRVKVRNLSQHNGLTLPMLLAELDSFREALSAADVVVVAIAHNSNELNADEPCGAPVDADGMPDWKVMTAACAHRSANSYRPQYDRLFSQVARWRSGRPTVLRTVNRYDDWRGAPGLALTTRQLVIVRTFVTTWDEMLCGAAERASFGCADLHRAFNGRHYDQASGDLLAGDYVHPSDKGNAVIARTLAETGLAPIT